MPRLTIQGGRVIDPAQNIDQIADVQIDGGKITQIGRIAKPDGAVLKADGLIVAPGLIDPHVHLREPGQEDKETIATGSAAAVSGGFTSICCMPNTQPALDDDARIEFVYRQAARAEQCNVYPAGALTKSRKGEELAEIALMARAGAVIFTDDGDAVASASMMQRALQYVKMTGKALCQHCEEPTLAGGGVMNAGALATRLGLSGRPTVAEELVIQRDITLNRSVGCRYHVQHTSAEASVELIRAARKQGQPVTAEATPHHLLLTEDCCAGYDPLYKINPPLRTKRDQQALLKGIKDGVITILGTDHAPHTREEKELEFAAAPSGIIGLEIALPLYIEALIASGTIDWPRLIAMMTIEPAKLLDLDNKGRLIEGGDADVTIIDPNESWTIDVEQFVSRSRNCPYHGRQVTGRAVMTMVGGQIKMNRVKDRMKRK